MPDATPARAPYPWPWVVAIILTASATGLCFGISPPLGFAMVGVTLAVVLAFVAWAVLRARRQRAAGHTPDLAQLRERLRTRAKGLSVVTVLVVAASAVGLATSDGDPPSWVFVMPPVLMLLGVGWIWFVVQVLLPRLQLQQASRSD